MTARAAALGLFLAAAGALPAVADHFTSIDLGPVPNRDACMAQAESVLQLYASGFGQSAATSAGSWTTSGWDLPPIGADVTILCVEVGGVFNAFATGHSVGSGPPPDETVEAIRDLFAK